MNGYIDFKLRILLVDSTIVDVYVSRTVVGKFGFHWERNPSGIYRYDNVPDTQWKNVATFPYHFHRGNHECVEASPFPLETVAGFRGFMQFVQRELKTGTME